jgi:general secretion pathway protein G
MEIIKHTELKSTNNRLDFPQIAMLLIVILGIFAVIKMTSICLPSRDIEEERIARAKVDISSLEAALEMYKLDNGRFPTSEEGLIALVERPASAKKWKEGDYLKKGKVPNDPWENEYVYLSPGNNGTPYDITSYGADGTPGGEGKNKDINCWEIE